MQSGAQLLDVVRKKQTIRQPTADSVVEVQNENFIVRIALFNKGLRRSKNVSSLRRHAVALIHENSHGYREIIISKCSNLLPSAVLKNGKAVL